MFKNPVYPLYLEHFGLTRGPFNVTPDPSFLYLSASHQEALAQIVYGINARKGFVVLTGEVGTGKTMLIHSLFQELDRNTKTALIFTSIINPNDLLRHICEEFELITVQQQGKKVHDYLGLLNQFILGSYRKGENVALIIDEAQNLSAEVLESIRLLSNFENPNDKLLQILLVGQPELTARLNAPELRQLKQRVVLRYHLRQLSLNECVEYIARRLELVSGDASIFTHDAIETVYLYSGGIPRLINVLCDNGMLTAYGLRNSTVAPEMIREVAEDLHLSPPFREFGGLKKENSRTEERNNFSFLDVKRDTKMEELAIRESVNAVGRTEGSTVPPQRNGREKVEEAGSHELSLDRVGAKQMIELRTVAEEAGSHELGLDCVPARFFECMISELTYAMGPMATFVVRDHIARLAECSEAFPKSRLTELVESAGQEILDESLKIRFRQVMLEEIPSMHFAKEEK